MPNEQDIMSELVALAGGVERGGTLDLTDRDDLDPATIIEVRSLLMRERNAIDTVSKSLAILWWERHGESGYVDPETGQIGYVTNASGPYQIEDPDGFAEWLRTLTNEEIAKVISGIRVSPIPDPIRKATLSQRVGSPVLTLTNTDNPKAPKWVQRGEEGTVVSR